jgi:Ca-activated chloride channel family protein
LIPLPPAEGELAVELRRRHPWGDRVVATVSCTLPTRTVEIEAPARALPSTVIFAKWSGDAAPEDLLTLVPESAPPERLGTSRISAEEGSLVALDVPEERCVYEVRYLDGRSHRILGSAPIEVSAPMAGLLAEPDVPAGRPFDLRWWGPAGANDMITIARPDAPDPEYLVWSPTSEISPTRFNAPSDAGEYEVRYVTSTGAVLARRPLAVTAVEARLNAPASIRVGARLRVSWVGPDNPGDFIAVVRKGQPLARAVDFVYVTAGSPTTVAVPFRPGPVEVHYVSGSNREILDSREVEVVAD